MHAGYKILIVLAIAAAIAAAGYKFGYDRGFDDRGKICAAAAEKKKKANEKVAAAGVKDLQDRLKSVLAEKAGLQEQLNELDKAAAADPSAYQCGLSGDSVRRINAVK
jgi:Tfp pilus assembly protein PilO